MSETEAKPLETGGMLYAPVGIGGWLILPIVHLVLNAGSILFYLGQGFLKGLSNSQVAGANVAGPNSEPTSLAFDRATASAISLSLFSLLIVLYALYCLVRFFQRKRSVPLLMIVFYVLMLILSVASYALLAYFPELQQSPQDTFSAGMGIVRTVVAIAIWIPYFLVSVRVKNTFVR